METFINLQCNIVLFLQNFANGGWKILWNIITFFANPIIFLLAFIIIYWNISKKEGARFAYNAIFVLSIVNIVKTSVNFKRPYQINSNIKMLEMDGSGTGSSFPSGHSALSASLSSSLLLSYLRSAFWIVFTIVIPVFVAVSRMVLGMHFPLDVLVGLGIGYGFTFIFYPLLLRLDSGLKKSLVLSVIFSSLLIVGAFVLSILMTTNTISRESFSDLVRSLSLLGGFILGRYFENQFVKYVTRARKAKKILRLILGLIPIAIAYLLLHRITPIISDFALYVFVAMWGTFLFPLIGIHSNLFYTV